MTGTGNSKQFDVGELVESVFDRGTVYRVSELSQPTHAGDYSTYLTLELVTKGSDDNAGRMADGRDYAPYHFEAVTC